MPVQPADLLSQLISPFYEAAFDPTGWQRGLQGLQAFADVRGCSLIQFDLQQGAPIISAQVGHSPDAQREYADHYHALDPMVPLAMAQPVGAWVNDWGMLPREERLRSEYYNDFATRHGIHAVMGVKLAHDDRFFGTFSLQRSPSQGAFGPEDQQRLEPLVRHLQLASRLQAQTSALRSQADLARAALDFVGGAVWITDGTGRVLLANAAAERTMADGTVFLAAQGRLQAVHGRQSLEEALALATRPAAVRASYLLLDPEGRSPPVAVLPLPAESPYGVAFQRPLALVLARGRQDDASKALRALGTLYGLTPAEARVALQVADGVSPADIARQGDVSASTVRAQLQSAYGKLRVRRQAELARLVLAVRESTGAGGP